MLRAATIALGLLFAASGSAVANNGFYDGKTVTYLVGSKPGGGYDAYARLVASYMERHLPGSQFVVENAPGAGSMVGANRIYNAEPDGLTIGSFSIGLIYAQLFGFEGVRFDLAEFGWIGKAASEPRVLVTGIGEAAPSIEDLETASEDYRFGTSGVGSSSYIELVAVAELTGWKLRAVPGYEQPERLLAIMRGDLHGTVGSLSSLASFVDNGDGRFLAKVAGSGDALPDVPSVRELLPSERGAAIMNILEVNTDLLRVTAAPPGVPEDRLAALRDAYRKALEDPDLLAEAERLGRPIDPAFGEEVGARVQQALAMPAEERALLARLLGCEPGADTCRPSR